MPCPRCHRLREWEAVEQQTNPSNNHHRQDQMNDDSNDQPVENFVYYGYGGYLPAIREPNIKIFNPYDQCFCRDQSLIQRERQQTGIEIPGKCYPVDLCTDCDLNYSGLCPQQMKYDSGIFVNDPYIRPIYFPPYTRHFPYSPYYPPWNPRPYRPNGYRPRPQKGGQSPP